MKMKSPPGILFLLPFAAITLLAPSSSAAAGGRRPRQARPDTPWEDLRASLSSPDALNLPTVVDWREQCLDPMIFDEAPLPDPFHLFGYDIGYAPAGVCMIHMSCMYPGCEYKFAGPESCPAGQEECVRPNSALEPPFDTSDLFDDEMELPAAVLHPRTAADVVRGVRFAKEHGVGVSVKVVGHSYFGSSTARGTLLIKMSTSYPMYGMDGSLTECSGDIGIDAGDDSAGGAACDLAAARGKKAYIRVGGGELFDTAYRAVFFDWNEDPANENNKYHFVGGYCGTVSAAGGWMHSGGLSGASMRLHGIGVDQVLHVEMVTPGGEHVRFGPTAWEDREGGIYPTTTEVTGYCNARPEEEDESLWEWAECEGEIDFADLWYAVRGGGGGTFGIVTSLYYQLHDLPGRVQVLIAHDDEFGKDLMKTADIVVDYLKFAFTFLYLPEKLNNVTEVESRSCNSPGEFKNIPSSSYLFCHNSVGDKFIEEWKAYVKGGLTATNYGDDAVFMSHVEGLWNIVADHPSQGYVTVRDDEPHKGRLKDDSGVLLKMDKGYGYDHVPLHTVTNYMDELVDIMVQEANAGAILGHYLMGGAVPESTDQMNSVGPLRRDAAFARTSLVVVGELYKNFYDLVWRDAGPGSDFPGIFCHNHASNENMGPLKEDWSRPCPSILEMPQEEREEKCVSQAESFWGTANVARLEEIKRAVDPNELFICNAGIGASSPFIGRNASRTGGDEAPEEADPPVDGEAGKADAEEGGDPATVDKEEGTGGGNPAATDGDNESAPANEDEAKDDSTNSPASSSFYSKGVMILLILAISLVI